jgi:hypothetical protein
MHLSGQVGQSAAFINRIGLGRDPATSCKLCPTELRGPILKHPGLRFLCVALHRLETRLRGAAAPAARCGSGQWRRVGSPLCRTARAALPKPFVPSGCASIGIIAAPLSESLHVKRWS